VKPRGTSRERLVRRVGRTHFAEVLLDISNKLAATPTLTDALRTVVELTAATIGAERGALFLNDSVRNELFSRTRDGKFEREIRIPNTLGIAGNVFTQGIGVIVNDAYADERFNRAVDEMTGYTTKTVLCVPSSPSRANASAPRSSSTSSTASSPTTI
jgi:adenylate cyclase